ncbi:MAG: hypothetical protein ASARMPREDX12_004894 [Alectoria sarmentosa]|nr:MAG: hypothetical protein ASARMPREDX12_004894 [Alectoria sarmentosa]
MQVPLPQDTTRYYFPLRQAVNESQYTLGRAFLQEAYVIVDYERSNFSVSQCRFEDGISTDLVAIPSASETPNHLRRNVAIGTSIGTASFFLLATLAAVFAIRRWRRKAMTQLRSETREPPTSSEVPRALVFDYPREIDHNSMVEPFRELPDSANANVELLNEHSPSGSGNEIYEMSEVLPPASHELRADGGSLVMEQIRTASSCNIFTSVKIPRKSWMSFASSDGAACVETVISASPQQRKEVSMTRASIGSSNLEAEIFSLYVRKPLDLDRSLPPTPISESPQISPILANFQVRSSFCQRPQMVNVSAHGSMSAFNSPARPV